MHDIERGNVSKIERLLTIWRRLLIQKKNLYLLLTLWFIFVMVLYDMPDQLHSFIIGVNTTAVVNVLKEQLPFVDIVYIPNNPLKRIEYVRNNVNLFDGQVSTPYEFIVRLRNDVSLEQISVDMDVIMQKFDYHCLAGVHVGYPKKIMKIDGKIYVNAKLIKHESKEIHVNEESAFYPSQVKKVSRYETIELEYYDELSYSQKTILTGIDAICAQHCLDTINGKKFLELEEL